MRYIAILLALVAVLALALLALPTSGPASGGSTPAGSTSLPTAPGQDSQTSYGSAIQAARNAVNAASQDAQRGANANP